MDGCLDRLRSWGTGHWHADGALPAPGVYGLPAQWPHIRALYERAGFIHDGHVEIVLLARVDELPQPSAPPVAGLESRRTVGINGTRLSAHLGDEMVGRPGTGCAWPGSTACSSTPGPRRKTSWPLLGKVGFRELTRTARGWHHRPGPAAL
jgi:hypothetical protein